MRESRESHRRWLCSGQIDCASDLCLASEMQRADPCQDRSLQAKLGRQLDAKRSRQEGSEAAVFVEVYVHDPVLCSSSTWWRDFCAPRAPA